MVRKGLPRLHFLKISLNFGVRGHFQIKILTVRGHSEINTTYVVWIIGACDHLKLVICQRITSKITRPRWVDTWARGTVRWYWSADTLFWQLSIYHNIDVRCVSSWSPKLARKCESKHWFPCGAGGRSLARSVGRCTVTWLPNFLIWGQGWIAYYACPWHHLFSCLARARGTLTKWNSCILDNHRPS